MIKYVAAVQTFKEGPEEVKYELGFAYFLHWGMDLRHWNWDIANPKLLLKMVFDKIRLRLWQLEETGKWDLYPPFRTSL